MSSGEVARGTPRHVSIDVVRGFAVCGIFAMNVVSMGMPAYAYVDPTYYGGARGADLAAWGVAYVLADGKMRALFSMLFGASLLIVTDAAEDDVPGPARVHYSRMGWLLVFGMLHAWLVWYGDILVEYALCGAAAFVARRWPPSALSYAAVLLIGWTLAQSLVQWHDMAMLRDMAARPGAPEPVRAAWAAMRDAIVPPRAAIPVELRLYRGTVADAFSARVPMTRLFQFTFLPTWICGTLGFVLLGMWLHRLGFWTGQWRSRSYARLLAAGVATLFVYPFVASAIVAHRFDPAFLPLADAASLACRPWLALGYASGLILLVRSGRCARLVARLAAAGRMAFSNYLGTSVMVTTLFYGYGFGLFGRLSRAELYLIVVLQWLLILGWSQPWLARFRYGPFEWLWRSLARWRVQPIRKSIAMQSQ